MPGTTTFRKKDGSTYQATVKWTPEEVDQMSKQQLIQMLTEMKTLAHYYFSTFGDPIIKLKDECAALEGNKASYKSGFIVSSIVFAVGLILWGIMKLTKHPIIAFCLVVLCILFLFCVVFNGFNMLSAKRQYTKRYPSASAELERLRQEENIFVTQTGSYALRSGIAVLPNYYLDEEALSAMISYLSNQRAATLAQAVNLYETEKVLHQQTNILNAQLASQQRTEAYAAAAAASAESAATSASITANNTLYNRKQ